MSLSATLFFIVEIIGTAAFALSGAMTGLKYKLDVFGIVFLAVVTALGGGCTRDIILGRVPPAMFRDYRYMLVAVLIALLAFLAARFAGGEYHKNEEKLTAIANIFDAAGLGSFVVVGMNAGINAGYGDNGFFLVFLGLLHRRRFAAGCVRGADVRRAPQACLCPALHSGRRPVPDSDPSPRQ